MVFHPPLNMIFPSPFEHDIMNFLFTYEKKLYNEEIKAGVMELAYNGFCELTLDRRTTALKLVDVCGNK